MGGEKMTWYDGKRLCEDFSVKFAFLWDVLPMQFVFFSHFFKTNEIFPEVTVVCFFFIIL